MTTSNTDSKTDSSTEDSSKIQNNPKNTRNFTTIVKSKTWFGLTAVSDVQPGRWHRAGYGNFLLTHPPVVNRLIRRGLAVSDNQHLSSLHEIGHLKMLPIEIAYAVIAFTLLYNQAEVSIAEFVIVTISCFSAWEMLAESHVISQSVTRYHLSYQSVSKLPRVIFWSITTFFLLAGCLIVFELIQLK